MKKVENIIKIVVICSLLIFCIPIAKFANEEIMDLQPIGSAEDSEKYKRWLELSDDEKKNYIEPSMYLNSRDNTEKKNFSGIDENIVVAGNLPSQYTKPYYGNVKDQGDKSICWACSSATAMESNYYSTTSIKKAFSELHMDYFTSKQYNTKGFYRNPDEGGNFDLALAYATNGMGLVPEASVSGKSPTEMCKIKSTQKVSEYVELNGKSEIKNYIYKYGVVPVYTYIDVSYFSTSSVYYNNNLAYCCDDIYEIPNHGVTLVGWDDNYKNNSFPGKVGAYIALNSYGAEFGNNGLYYIFYDDVFVNETLYGITKTDNINYDYIYQYDEYGINDALTSSNNNIYAANVFNRNEIQTVEKLTDISFYLPAKQRVTCYVNSISGDISIDRATNQFTTDVLDAGYHTITLNQPISVTGEKFAVIIKYSDTVPIERNVNSTNSWYYTVKSNGGESYISTNGVNYEDLQDLVRRNSWYNYANFCIKAFTKKTNEINYKQNKSDLENYLFDYKYYAEHNRDLYCAFGYNQTALRNHWNQFGKAEGRQASPILNLKYYVEKNGDLSCYKNNYVGAYNHFLNFGFAEYRNSSPEYNGKFYKNSYYDLLNMASMQSIRHYYNYGKKELRRANTNYDITPYLFDANVYAKFNQDVVRVYGNNPDRLRYHWYKFGIAEGRIASMIFDARGYLNSNSDVARVYSANNYNGAYDHFINYGFAEGRQGNAIFSASYYLNKNQDLKNAFGNNCLLAVNHFSWYGKNEFRQTSAKFYVSKYRAKNADLNRAYGNNPISYFEHYLVFGQREKRICL